MSRHVPVQLLMWSNFTECLRIHSSSSAVGLWSNSHARCDNTSCNKTDAKLRAFSDPHASSPTRATRIPHRFRGLCSNSVIAGAVTSAPASQPMALSSARMSSYQALATSSPRASITATRR